MREIRFRGKSILTGNWVTGENILKFKEGNVFIMPSGEPTIAVEYGYSKTAKEIGANVSFNYIEVIPETVGQYIGINDKYDMKIFEGDIVRNKRTGVWHAQGDVRYGKYLYSADDEYECTRYGFYVHSPWKAYTDNTGYCFTHCDMNNWEIIGNIHDTEE